MFLVIFPEKVQTPQKTINNAITATSLIEQASRKESHPTALILRAEALYRLNRFNDSILDATNAIRLDPKNPEAHYALARAKIHQTFNEPSAVVSGAVLNLANAIALDGKNPLYNLYLACWYYSQSSIELAKANFIKTISKAEQISDSDREKEKQDYLSLAHYHLGCCFCQEERWDLAQQGFEKVINIGSPSCVANAYHNLGCINTRLGNHQKGEVLIKKALELETNNWYIHFDLAQNYWLQDKPLPALFYVEAALNLIPNHPHLQSLKINLLQTLGQTKEAANCAASLAKNALSDLPFPLDPSLLNDDGSKPSSDPNQEGLWNYYHFFDLNA